MSKPLKGNPLKISLCEDRAALMSTFIDAEILENGDLQLSGQQVGQLIEERWGDSDYEYWLTVPKEHKDRLLLVLLDQIYHGDISADVELKKTLEEKAIPHVFDNYI